MKLRECPLCKAAPVISTTKETFNELVKENSRACIAIDCSACGLVLFYPYSGDDYDTMLEKAISHWNRSHE